MDNPIASPPAERLEQDDFTKIDGINRTIANRLQRVGIKSYRDLAAKTPADLASLLGAKSGIPAETISSENWIGQAQSLAKAISLPAPAAAPANRQRYALFTLKLLLDEPNKIRRLIAIDDLTHVEVVWPKTTEWPAWDQGGLCAFIQASVSGAASPKGKAAPVADDKEQKAVASVPEPNRDESPTDLQHTGEFVIVSINLASLDNEPYGLVIPAGKPFRARLQIDFSSLGMAGKQELEYQGELYAETGFPGSSIRLTKFNGVTGSDAVFTDEQVCDPLPAGGYRLGAYLIVNESGQRSALGEQICSFIEGKRIIVY